MAGSRAGPFPSKMPWLLLFTYKHEASCKHTVLHKPPAAVMPIRLYFDGDGANGFNEIAMHEYDL